MARNSSFTKASVFSEPPKAIPNISRLISDHQRGVLKKASFESQVTETKVGQLQPSGEEFEIDPLLENCKFIRTNDNDYVVGIWERKMDPASKHSTVYHLKFEYHHQPYAYDPFKLDLSCSGPYFKRMDVTDSCERNMKDKRYLLYVGNTAVSGGRIVLNIINSINDADRNATSGLAEVLWRSPKRIWSCASNANTEQFAAGSEDGCFVFDMLNFVEVENMQGNILSMEFNKSGNLLYCGRDKGELALYDLRQDSIVNINFNYQDTIFDGFKEMRLLSDEVSLIVCKTTGTLWRMDLRMNRPVLQYPVYRNSHDRRPFSVSDELDLLCATGDDNNTRVWSLQTGKELKCYRPYKNIYSNACLISSQRRWFVAVVQANFLNPIQLPCDYRREFINDEQFYILMRLTL